MASVPSMEVLFKIMAHLSRIWHLGTLLASEDFPGCEELAHLAPSMGVGYLTGDEPGQIVKCGTSLLEVEPVEPPVWSNHMVVTQSGFECGSHMRCLTIIEGLNGSIQVLQGGFILCSITYWEHLADLHVSSCSHLPLALEGTHIRATFVTSKPFIVHGPSGLQGLFVDILEQIQANLGFSVDYIPSLDGQWGGMDANGSWNGMVSMLIHNQADICVTSLSMTLDRAKVIGYSQPLVNGKFTLIMSDQKSGQFKFGGYLEVFATPVWICVPMLLALKVLILTALLKQGTGWQWGPLAQALGSLGSWTIQRGTRLPPRVNGSLKIGIYTMSLCLYLLFVHFTADLTTTMTVEPSGPEINSFQDFLESGYSMQVRQASASHDALIYSRAGSALHRLYYESMLDDPNGLTQALDPNEIADFLQAHPDYAFFGSPFQFQTLVGRFHTILSLQDSLVDPLAFGFQKNSYLIPHFNECILKLKQTGVMNKLISKWIPSPTHSDNPHSGEQSDHQVLGYESLSLPFLALVLGLIMTPILSLLEYLCHYWLYRTKSASRR